MSDKASKRLIEVDAQAAEILDRASLHAQANHQTLGDYLRTVLPHDTQPQNEKLTRQARAWETFVRGMTEWCRSYLPSGYVADDSRDSIYD